VSQKGTLSFYGAQGRIGTKAQWRRGVKSRAQWRKGSMAQGDESRGLRLLKGERIYCVCRGPIDNYAGFLKY